MANRILQYIGASENPVIKFVALLLRLPIRCAQWKLLKIQKNDPSGVNLVERILADGCSLMWPTEMVQIYNCVSAVKKLGGDFAEVGVYTGRSAKLVCEIKGENPLHLFDTFQGLPKPVNADSETMKESMYAASLDSVKSYLHAYKQVFFYPGMFPDTAGPVKDRTFAFVHLDVDIYQSTLEGLKFFYSKMVSGGIILSHDYSSLDGVKKAFDEFFVDKKESVIELSTNQCLVVKA